jgi:hypothetical protein
MEEGKRCPWCKEDIGIWTIVRAVWPTLIRCPICGSNLTYEIPLWRTMFLIILPIALFIFLLSTGPVYLVYKKIAPKPLLISALLFIALWVVFEFGNAVYWRKYKKLKIIYGKSNK